MRVKLILDLINNLSPGARAARKDLGGVRTEAKALRDARAGQKLKADLMALAPAAAKAGRELGAVKRAARETDGSAIGRLRRELDGAGTSAARLKRELAGLGAGGALRAGQGVAGSAGRTGSGGALAAGALGAAGVPLGVLGGGVGAYGVGRATIGTAVSRDKALADVRKKVDLPDGASFENLTTEISSMAIAYGRSFEDIASIYAEAGAAGIAFRDLAGFATLATKAAIAWDMPAQEAAQKLFEIRAATGLTLPGLQDMADKINALGDTSAAKERDILEMFQRAGAAAKAAGVSFDASLAFLTAMRSIGIAPEVGARGFNALVSKMATADDNKKVGEGLKLIGLNAKEMAALVKTDATAALLKLFRALDKAPDPIKAAVKIFGQEWFDEMLRSKEAIGEVTKNLATLNDPAKWKGSSERTLNIELATTANHLERLKSLAGEVGDRLGKWALPPINEAIQRIVEGLKELDRRSGAKAEAAATGDKIDRGEALSPEERQRMVEDETFRRRVEYQVAGRKEQKDVTRLTNTAEVNRLEAERAALERSIANRLSAGADEGQLAFSRRRVRQLTGQIGLLDPSKAPASRKPADQDDRATGMRMTEVLALQTRMAEIEARLRSIDALKTLAGSSADKAGFAADAEAHRKRRTASMRELGQLVAPAAMAQDRFGLGPTGAPSTAGSSGGIGPGRFGFGAGGSALDALRSSLEIDLGPAARSMMEKVSDGMVDGKAATDAAAGQVGEGVRQRLGSVDLTPAGQQMMGSLAAGITAGGAQAVAAAEAVAARVRTTLANAGSGRRGAGNAHSDGLHDLGTSA